MAHEEPVAGSAGTQDVETHIHDYSNFIRLLKIGAVVCFIIGISWMLIIKAYW